MEQRNFVNSCSKSASFALACNRYPGRNDLTPLVVIHGICGSKRNWDEFCRVYNNIAGREVIAMDCRNHGESRWSPDMAYSLMCGDIEKTLIELKIPKCVLIGHSVGGRLVMNMALSMPSYVEKLVVVDTSHLPADPQVVHRVRAMIQAMLDEDLSQAKTMTDVDDILAKSVAASNDTRNYLLQSSLIKDDQGRFLWQLNLKELLNNVEQLLEGFHLNGRKEYEGETLIVGGQNSPGFRASDMPQVKEIFPKASLQMVSRAGHFVHADQPRVFLKIIDKFLTQSAPDK